MRNSATPAAPEVGTPGSQNAFSGRPSWIPTALLAAAYLAFWQIAPRIRADSEGAVLISTILALVLFVAFCAQLARTIGSPRALAWNLALSAALALPLRFRLGAGANTGLLAFVLAAGLPDLLFVWFATSLGVALSFLLRSANMIPPVAAVLALVDVWTVLLGGPVQRIMQSANPVAQAVKRAMTVELPAPSVGAAPYKLITMVGFADFLFIAFFVAGVCRFIPHPRAYGRTLKAVLVVLGLYMLVVHFTGLPLPALLPLAVVMIAVHWRSFHYSRSEVFALLYATAFILAIVAGFWFWAHREIPLPPSVG